MNFESKTLSLGASVLIVTGILIMVGTTASAHEPAAQTEPQPAETQAVNGVSVRVGKG